MRTYNFNTDGNKEEIANIIEQELETCYKPNSFDVEKIEEFEDISGERCIRVYIAENDNENEESFSHEIVVEKIDVNEYQSDLTLVY